MVRTCQLSCMVLLSEVLVQPAMGQNLLRACSTLCWRAEVTDDETLARKPDNR